MPEGMICIPKTSSREELARIYTAADVFVNPTYEDTFPTVNLEAEACGTMVIPHNIGGCGETLLMEESILIPPGEVIEYVQKAI